MNPLGMSIEIELAFTGGEEDGVDNTDVIMPDYIHSPEDVNHAFEQLHSGQIDLNCCCIW